jgi:aspartate racemase
MRMIGMVGGLSWESTAEYYRLLNELVRDRLGGLHSARCVLTSVDFAEIEHLQAAGEWERAGQVLADAARGLSGAGAEVVLICSNTMHTVADAVQAAAGIPLLHIADSTARAVRVDGVETVGLLGTAYTMEGDFLRSRLAEQGLNVLVPGEADRKAVHRIIYDELCVGVVREESREIYREVIRRLVDDGANGIILGCTEIELLIGAADSPVPLFPTTRLHAEAAVDWALS